MYQVNTTHLCCDYVCVMFSTQAHRILRRGETGYIRFLLIIPVYSEISSFNQYSFDICMLFNPTKLRFVEVLLQPLQMYILYVKCVA